MVEKRNIWVALHPLDKQQIAGIRADLSKTLPPAFTPEPYPHITVLQCNLPKNTVKDLRDRARRLGLIGRTFHVTGIECHPNARNPKYITLALDLNIGAAQTKLQTFLESHDGELLGEPSPPHITLWKNQPQQQIDQDTSMALAERISALRNDARWCDRIGGLEVSSV